MTTPSSMQATGSAAVRPAPSRFHLLAKPSGSTCNLDCTYCFFLSKEALYPDTASRMPGATLEAYIAQLLESHRGPEVTVAWQGGEPTLMGLDFFARSVELVEAYRRPGQRVEFTMQTNGVLLDDAWCAFLKEHGFLVGLSVDGPAFIHDTYRVDRGGRGSHRRVMKGLAALRGHDVDVNILCTVNAANQDHGAAVYRYFRDELEVSWMQFIPVVERATPETLPLANQGWSAEPSGQRLLYTQTGSLVTERSVVPASYGQFLVDVYEEWLRGDVGTVFVQLFDVTLEAYFGQYSLCIHAPTCGTALALEHNGDVYSCDHFVEPDHLLGNIHETHLLDLVSSPRQQAFGLAKRETLTAQCRSCDVLALCNGGCPKDRFVDSRDGEPGHNYLCDGLYRFYTHTRPTMTAMAQLVRQGRYADEVMAQVAAADAERDDDAPCPCGGGAAFGGCHKRQQSHT
jgi:serine-type anaerobic sulfatase-maturating enzyme